MTDLSLCRCEDKQICSLGKILFEDFFVFDFFIISDGYIFDI